MKAPLSNRDLFTEPMFRKIRNLWDKMEQTVSGKRRIIRFEKQLQECFKDMPQFIMDILYGIILNQAKIGTEHIEGYLKEVSHRLGVRI